MRTKRKNSNNFLSRHSFPSQTSWFERKNKEERTNFCRSIEEIGNNRIKLVAEIKVEKKKLESATRHKKEQRGLPNSEQDATVFSRTNKKKRKPPCRPLLVAPLGEIMAHPHDA